MLGGAQRQLVALHPGTREEVGRSFQRFLSEFEGPWDNFQLFIGDLLSLIVSESVSVIEAVLVFESSEHSQETHMIFPTIYQNNEDRRINTKAFGIWRFALGICDVLYLVILCCPHT